MIALASDTRVWLAAGMTDMRKGFDGLAALVATTLEADPLMGHCGSGQLARSVLPNLLLDAILIHHTTDCSCPLLL